MSKQTQALARAHSQTHRPICFCDPLSHPHGPGPDLGWQMLLAKRTAEKVSISRDSKGEEPRSRRPHPGPRSPVAQLHKSGQVPLGPPVLLSVTRREPSGPGCGAEGHWAKTGPRVLSFRPGPNSGQEGEGPAGLGAAPARARGWIGKAASRARPPAPPRPGQPPFQSPPRPPGGSARGRLAMSQPGQKPAASPRPRRAAAARRTQEVSGARVRAAGPGTGRTPAQTPRAAASGRSRPGPPPGAPPPVLGRTGARRGRAGAGGGQGFPGRG